MKNKYLSLKRISMIALMIGAAGCTGDVSFLGTGTTPGAPAPLGVESNNKTPSSSQPEALVFNNNSRVTVKGRGGSKIFVGSEDGVFANLKGLSDTRREAETLVEATRETLRFMGIEKDYELDGIYQQIETGWYKGQYKAIAIINRKNLHASSLDLKIMDIKGRRVEPDVVRQIEDAIFNRTKQINKPPS